MNLTYIMYYGYTIYTTSILMFVNCLSFILISIVPHCNSDFCFLKGDNIYFVVINIMP